MKITAPLTAFMVLAATVSAQPLLNESPGREEAAYPDHDRELAALLLQAIQLDPGESRPFYLLGVLAGNPETALYWFKRYAQLEPDDAWGWLAVGDMLLRLGKTLEARQAYKRAAKLAPGDKPIKQSLARGILAAAPKMESITGYLSDSDGVRIHHYGGRGDVALSGGLRVGARYVTSSILDANGEANADELQFRLEGRPNVACRLDVMLGGIRMETRNRGPWQSPEADLRFRYRASRHGPELETRLLQTPLALSPLLVTNRVVTSEGRFGVDLPLGPFRLRGMGRIATIQASNEAENRRDQADATLALPLGWRGEISAQYHRKEFERVSRAGYFAPRFVETIECGTYWQLGDLGLVTLEMDLGVGIQRLAKQNEEPGSWKPAFRSWSILGISLSSALQWRTETEFYESTSGPLGAPSGSDWKSMSITTGLRVCL